MSECLKHSVIQSLIRNSKFIIRNSQCEALVAWVYQAGFPHSEIPGSRVAKHLPEAYRSHATSFIAVSCQGIHHLHFVRPLHKYRNIVKLRNRTSSRRDERSCTLVVQRGGATRKW